MKRLVLLVAVVFLWAIPAVAQTPLPSSPSPRLEFDYDTGVADGFAYFLDGRRVDLGSLPPSGPASDQRPGSSTYTFVVPAMTPGLHTVEVIAFKSGFDDSPKSNTLTLQVLVMVAPRNIRLRSQS